MQRINNPLQQIAYNKFIEAVKNGDVSEVKSALSQKQFKIDVNLPYTYSNGMTALHYAALYGHEEIVKLLLAHGASVNPKTTKDQFIEKIHKDSTPLQLAASHGHFHITLLLLENG